MILGINIAIYTVMTREDIDELITAVFFITKASSIKLNHKEI